MPFRRYLQRHYIQACELQRGIVRDPLMVHMVHQRTKDRDLVKAWMRNYGLFQGVSGQQRSAAVKAFLRFVDGLNVLHTRLTPADTAAVYESLMRSLHRAVPRGWVSASSKLLWCVYPHDFVIYDTFVHRAMVVLQCLDDDLIPYPRIGTTPSVEAVSDIKGAVDHYMNFQALVKLLQKKHQVTLDSLRQKHHEQYPYDVRIVDKLLWMMGNATFRSER